MLRHDDRDLMCAGPGHTLVSAWLRVLRTQAGIRMSHAAALSGLSDSTIIGMETAGIRLVHRNVMKLLNIYGRGGTDQGRAVAALLTGTDSSVRDGAPGWAARLRAAEDQAEAITSINNQHVPAPLQTPAYADALRRSLQRFMDHDQREHSAAAVRSAPRDELPGTYRAFVEEAVLVRPFGGPAVMAEQVAHLEHVMTCGVDLRLIPFTRPCHVPDQTRLEFTSGQALYPVEMPLFAVYRSPASAAMHHRMALKVLDQRAASPRDTRRLLEGARRRLQQGAAAGVPVHEPL